MHCIRIGHLEGVRSTQAFRELLSSAWMATLSSSASSSLGALGCWPLLTPLVGTAMRTVSSDFDGINSLLVKCHIIHA